MAAQRYSDALSFRWATPRPEYMRELEPLAHAHAWPSTPTPAGTPDPMLTADQRLNRQLLIDGRTRKDAAGAPYARQPEEERKTGCCAQGGTGFAQERKTG